MNCKMSSQAQPLRCKLIVTHSYSVKSLIPAPAPRNSLSEEKRRLDGRLATLEEDLEEEQMNAESAIERARKAQEQADQASSELAQSQSNVSKLEKSKGQLEKQVSQAGATRLPMKCACMCTN